MVCGQDPFTCQSKKDSRAFSTGQDMAAEGNIGNLLVLSGLGKCGVYVAGGGKGA